MKMHCVTVTVTKHFIIFKYFCLSVCFTVIVIDYVVKVFHCLVTDNTISLVVFN